MTYSAKKLKDFKSTGLRWTTIEASRMMMVVWLSVGHYSLFSHCQCHRYAIDLPPLCGCICERVDRPSGWRLQLCPLPRPALPMIISNPPTRRALPLFCCFFLRRDTVYFNFRFLDCQRAQRHPGVPVSAPPFFRFFFP